MQVKDKERHEDHHEGCHREEGKEELQHDYGRRHHHYHPAPIPAEPEVQDRGIKLNYVSLQCQSLLK